MALWNDKRTPKGVITDSRSGASGTLPASIRPDRASAPRSVSPTPSADRERFLTNPLPAKVEQGPVQNRQAAPRHIKAGKVPVDKPTNAAAAAGARQDKSNVKGSKASGKPAPRRR